jgi:hypothetical protein
MAQSFTPKLSGRHRRYKRQDAAVPAGIIHLVAVFALLIRLYVSLPPIR